MGGPTRRTYPILSLHYDGAINHFFVIRKPKSQNSTNGRCVPPPWRANRIFIGTIWSRRRTSRNRGGTPWSLPASVSLVRVAAANWSLGTQLKATEPEHSYTFSGAKTAAALIQLNTEHPRWKRRQSASGHDVSLKICCTEK